MDEFKVKLNQVRSSVSERRQIVRELSSIRNDLNSIRSRLGFRIRQRERINTRLMRIGDVLAHDKDKMEKVTSALDEIADLYYQTEMRLCDRNAPSGQKPDEPGEGETKFDFWEVLDPKKIWEWIDPLINPMPPHIPYIVPWLPLIWNISPRSIINVIFPYPVIVPVVPTPFELRYRPIRKDFLTPIGPGGQLIPSLIYDLLDKKDDSSKKIVNINDLPKDLATNRVQSVVDKAIEDAAKNNPFAKEVSEKLKSAKDGVDQFSKDHTKDLYQKKTVYDSDSKTWKSVDVDDEKAVKAFDDGLKASKLDTDIKLATVGGSASVAAWEGAVSASGKYGSASASAKFGEAEAHAEGYAGLYQTDPTTGKLTFKPGIGGSVGASVTAFSAEEEASLGNDMLGVYVKSTQTAGKVEATAEGSIGLYDSKGNFNPSAYAGFGAQAIAGEITGSAGAKILGADVSASGSLNYGIGAHANVGYQDGKLSVDIGATLGVGASVKLEVDVGGTVDAVCDGAKAAWEGAKDAWGDIKKGAKKFFKW